MVSIGVSLIIIVSVYNAYTSIFSVVYTSRSKIDAIDLVNEQLEIVRNLPYANVGIVSGIPSGVLTHSKTIVRGGTTFNVLTTVRNIDDPFDGILGGSPNDTSPADFKVVEIEISCAQCRNFKPMIVTTRVAPKNLENTSTNGALFVKVFDANGNVLPDANVRIVNTAVSPNIIIEDVTNLSGMLQVVDVPPGSNTYQITVTKDGYSTDKTYLASSTNPHPTKPHATIVKSQVTQTSFNIDKLSTLNISSLSDTCAPVSSMDFSLVGSKNVGLIPTVPKYSQNKVTNSSGTLYIPNMEWDAYTITNIDTVYDIIGSSVISPIALSPNSTQNVDLIVAPKNIRTLLAIVSDSSNNLPLSGVSVRMTKTGYDVTKITGQGYMGQTDWSGGGGQATSTVANKYLSSDGNAEVASPVGDVTLKKILNLYVPHAELISSSFDTGTASNFQQIVWSPVGQPATSNVRVQIATNSDGGVWNFNGPDGTSSTYYTASNQNIHSSNNGNRYLRYKLILDSTSTASTPNISDMSFIYTLSCTPPGQVNFSGLASGTYTLTLTKTGYANKTVSVSVASNWQSTSIIMQKN